MQEIQILWSTDNAGNSENLVPASSVYPRIGISRSASKTDNRFYLSRYIIRADRLLTISMQWFIYLFGYKVGFFLSNKYS